MKTLPIADIVGLPRLIRQSLHQHVAEAGRAKDFRLQASWKTGPAAGAEGPTFVSFTEFTPHRLSDIIPIWLAADRLGDELVEIGTACGVQTYLQPGRRRVGSLSAWTSEQGLLDFIRLPHHLEIMRRYRSRGLPLRSARWWCERFEPEGAMAEGARRLEASAARGHYPAGSCRRPSPRQTDGPSPGKT